MPPCGAGLSRDNITSPAAVGSYNFQWRMAQNSARFGAFSENASVTVSESDGAAFVSQSVPEVMAPGQMVNNSTRFGAFTTNFPVDVVQGQAQTLYFVHTDHLNTHLPVAPRPPCSAQGYDLPHDATS